MKMNGQTAEADEQKQKRDLTPTNEEDVQFSEGEFELFPEDDQEVKFIGFRKETGQYGERLMLLFDSVEHFNEQGEPLRIFKWAGATFSSKGFIRPMLTAMGVDVDGIDRSTFRLANYVGGRLRINVVHEKKQGDDGPYTVAKITGYLKSKLGKRQPWEKKEDREPVAAAASERKRKLMTEDDDD